MISPGLRIGRYEIGKRLGKGGFGVVHLARDVDLDREIAIKVLKPEYLMRPQIVQRFLKEARAAAKIGHAGIVTMFECGEIQGTGTRADGNAYIAMELLVGQSLADRLLDGGRMSVIQAVTITRQLAAALAAAHGAGIVHRDLKPDNVFLVPDAAVHGGERVKILDFGVAKLFEPSSDGVDTHSQMMLGTPKYMSPEQARSAAKVDHRADIYTLGCMLFEMLCGRGPFTGDAGEQLLAHQKSPPPSAREIVPTVPLSIDALIKRMLAKSPSDRPRTMTEVVDALAETPDEPDTVVRTPLHPSGRPSAEITTVQDASPVRWLDDRRRWLLTIALGTIVVSGLVVFMVMRDGSDQPARAPAKTVEARIDAAVDAAAEAAVVHLVAVQIDAGSTSSDELARLNLECKAAVANQKWADAITCAEALRKLDPATGAKIHAQAHAEERAEVSARALDAALANDDWKKAKAALDAIGQDSVYRHPAEQHVGKAEQAATDKLAGALVRTRAKGRDCKSYDAIVKQNVGVLPKAVVDAARHAVTCTPGFANKDPVKEPAKEPKPCSADELFQQGMDSFASGSNPQALGLFEQAYNCRADANTLKLTFAAACKSKSAAKAKTYWKKMSQGMKDSVIQFCVSNGVSQDYLNAP